MTQSQSLVAELWLSSRGLAWLSFVSQKADESWGSDGVDASAVKLSLLHLPGVHLPEGLIKTGLTDREHMHQVKGFWLTSASLQPVLELVFTEVLLVPQ